MQVAAGGITGSLHAHAGGNANVSSSEPTENADSNGDPQSGDFRIKLGGVNGAPCNEVVVTKARDKADNSKSWSSLFGKKPSGKSSFLPATCKSDWQKLKFKIFIPDP